VVVVGVVAAELLTELSPEWGRRGELSVGGRGDSMSCALPLVLLLVVVPLMMDVMCVCMCVCVYVWGEMGMHSQIERMIVKPAD